MGQYSYGKTLLEVKDVCLDYDGKSILRNVNVSIRDIIRPNCTTGQIVGFLGLSGIGKSQLFRIMAGLNKPTSGYATVRDDHRPVEAGEVGVVSQHYPLFDHLSILQNLMLAATKKDKDKKIAKERVMAYLNEFKLADKIHVYPAELSGGQRQRIAITQQILSSEHYLLMDEPFSGLDVVMQDKVCESLQKVANLHELNTIVVVTHDVTAAASISDHLWIMGRERDQNGETIPGARIMKEYSLIERDLCWQPGIVSEKRFTDFVAEVKNELRFM